MGTSHILAKSSATIVYLWDVGGPQAKLYRT
jgi:hypothetical protein